MTVDHILTGVWLIVTFGIIVSGYNISKGSDPRTLAGYLVCVVFWPFMLAFALLAGCFYAVLVYLKVVLFAVNYFFGIDTTGRR